ncbi:glycosyltransferase family 2 protein [Mesorhizobium sp.]|uniref:glycosyltransferase family 2 protein n=1 Tax=Mesorhizobium sp. TaxID=1871066 RepID=UPI000FE9ED4D|nr:glycosyltransferase family 2 protein [Mesorhizobium sp.]RWD75125.1 MAG: glycosyltransferase family 2 protein [Mesorhizobium sp.]RWE79271.1 MAG: glycosyltransferase family 2 protein [Mesorhizobium sp.]TIV32922.1 MAG: glycosyltransferase family 2 protein [Mesorhizobium sp.]TIV61948.1 MAG: glycosyltransferase family 2 protein [Mesorhizobium sp.]TIW29797.1 MAG: glycosyltransferase family 2 protein [Mesorhizobium sp.]
MPLIDIVIPNYCYGRYLPQAVESIVRQQVEDIRILIVDNASTDDSVGVANALARHDKRIAVVAREKNLGLHASCNEGVDWARSKYFVILCADDLLVEGCFRRALSILEREPDVSFACGAELVWHEDRPFPKVENSAVDDWRFLSMESFALERSLPSRVLFGGGAALIRTSDLKRVGHFRSEISYSEDLEMFLRLSLDRRAAITKAVHGIRRVHGANLSAIFWQDFKRDLIEKKLTYDSFFSHEAAGLPSVKQLRRSIYRNLGKRAYWSGLSHIARGQRAAGLDLLRFAAELSPSLAYLPPVDYLVHLPNPLSHIRSRLAEAWSRH